MAFALAAALLAQAVPAAHADDPPAFMGAVGQFTLIRPLKEAPLQAVDDEKGNPVDLAAALKGKVVVLNFWATWCAPCVQELPTLDKLQGELGSDKFQVVAVSVDLRGMEKVGPFWKEKGFKHLAIRIDQRSIMMRAFKARGLPTTFLIDAEGKVRGYLEGHADWASPEAKALVRYYLERAPR
ncbi:MAG: TlpA family protein disulfide reductase [Rhodospirillaceae bacterium]|nr:TlpA family protein disulfide reductase [Rhodospirillaceae bacterium]